MAGRLTETSWVVVADATGRRRCWRPVPVGAMATTWHVICGTCAGVDGGRARQQQMAQAAKAVAASVGGKSQAYAAARGMAAMAAQALARGPRSAMEAEATRRVLAGDLPTPEAVNEREDKKVAARVAARVREVQHVAAAARAAWKAAAAVEEARRAEAEQMRGWRGVAVHAWRRRADELAVPTTAERRAHRAEQQAAGVRLRAPRGRGSGGGGWQPGGEAGGSGRGGWTMARALSELRRAQGHMTHAERAAAAGAREVRETEGDGGEVADSEGGEGGVRGGWRTGGGTATATNVGTMATAPAEDGDEQRGSAVAQGTPAGRHGGEARRGGSGASLHEVRHSQGKSGDGGANGESTDGGVADTATATGTRERRAREERDEEHGHGDDGGSEGGAAQSRKVRHTQGEGMDINTSSAQRAAARGSEEDAGGGSAEGGATTHATAHGRETVTTMATNDGMVRQSPQRKRKQPSMCGSTSSTEAEMVATAHVGGDTRQRTGGCARANGVENEEAMGMEVEMVRHKGAAQKDGERCTQAAHSSTGEVMGGESASAQAGGADGDGGAATRADAEEAAAEQADIAGKRRRGVEDPNMDGKHARRRSPRVALMEARQPAPTPAAARQAGKRRSTAGSAGGQTGRKKPRTAEATERRTGYVQRKGVAAGPLKYMIKVGPTMVRRMEDSGQRRDAAAAAAAARHTRTWDDGG